MSLLKVLKVVQAFHLLANPRCITPEEAREGTIIWEAVKRELSAQGISYADILGAKATLEVLIEHKLEDAA